jgi:GNAT superfamily N-acetyltransferase
MATNAAMHHITDAAADHLPHVRDLAHAIWPQAYANVLKPVQIENMLERIYSLQNLTHEMQSGHRFFLAWRDKTPLGYASMYKDADTIWLKKLYVHVAEQGRGIGQQLLQHAIAAFLPASRVNLLVNKDNTPAQRFYERSGFARSGETPVQMGDHQFIDYIYSRPITAISVK